MINVLFVCLGNICRSPMADAVFQAQVKNAGLDDKIKVDSAGTGGWHIGETAHPGTRSTLKKHDIPYDGRARQFKPDDLITFDYVLGMDASNFDHIQRNFDKDAHNAEINLFLHYANEAGTVTETEVPDPYYTGGFEHVFSLVERGGEALLNHIRKQHKL
ncbi:MAG: low molecular weight protein-tyrosine-phosphatase [Aggregatilineales bacterium]